MFGSSPNESSQPQNIFVRVESWTWISRPMTGSSSAIAALWGRVEADRPLERVSSVEDLRFAERRPGNLETDRKLGAAAVGLREAGRNRDRGDPGKRHRHGEEVVQVHRQRVVGLRAELEGDRRRGRSDDEVAALEGRAE